jgi:hypothetical protein
MSRWTWFLTCATLGLVMLVCGWLVPMHLRAVDGRVIEMAGNRTPGLIARAETLLDREKQLEPALLILQAARQQALPGWDKLGVAITNVALRGLSAGDAAPLKTDDKAAQMENTALPFAEVVIRLENQQQAMDMLRKSASPAVQALLMCRNLTNTVLFPPAQSDSGQAIDGALSICGLLLSEGRLSPALSNTVFKLAAQGAYDSQPIEQVLMDMLSLGERLNWSQLSLFVHKVEEPKSLRVLANSARQNEPQLPVLFSALALGGNPDRVAGYLEKFSQTGIKDLGASLRFGSGGIDELLRRNQRLYVSGAVASISAKYPLSVFSNLALERAWHAPLQALVWKWFLYLAAGFLFAAAAHFARPAVSLLERPLQVRGFHYAREILFALGFLLVVLLLSEPFLAQDSQKMEFHFRLRLSTLGSPAPAGVASAKSIMNQPSQILTLLLFFVLQGLIYTACLVKLAEIRRQKAPARVKLKLLENEDHLFDAGLYLGFVGTIISLILVSMNIVQFSLMAAYSSTSFGIIFVSIFKIFHLRPARRRLLLEAEAASAEPAPLSQQRPAFATSP